MSGSRSEKLRSFVGVSGNRDAWAEGAAAHA